VKITEITAKFQSYVLIQWSKRREKQNSTVYICIGNLSVRKGHNRMARREIV